MSAIDRLRPLAVELLEVEKTFGPNREPPNERIAARWLHLTSDFRVAHGLPRGYPGASHRSILRLPCNATMQCRLPSGTIEALCTSVGHGGVSLSTSRSGLALGARFQLTKVDHLGKVYELTIPADVRWQRLSARDTHVGVQFDTETTWSRDVFMGWYWAVFHEYLRAIASGEDVKPLIASETARAEAEATARTRMLIVDDEPENAELIARAFRGQFEIFTAPDGETALALALRIKPHVVITDQRMPKATGVELLSNLRWHLPNTVRILVTGFMSYNTLVDAVNLAMVHHYVEKPIQIDSLIGAVKTLFPGNPPR